MRLAPWPTPAAASLLAAAVGLLVTVPAARAQQAGLGAVVAAAPDSGAVAAPPLAAPPADLPRGGAPAVAPMGPTAVAGPTLGRAMTGINLAVDDSSGSAADTTVRRTHAVEYSQGYYTRLAIHRVASYTELPLFATEFVLGEKILNDERNGGRAPSGLRSAHTIVAGGLGALFAVNTVTGVWNLLEARHDPNGRTRRTVHAVGMLLADAGFLWTATLADGARRSDAGANRHRNAAIASMSVATASTLIMWLWKK